MDSIEDRQSLDDVCRRLDEVVVGFFSTLSQLYQEQSKMEATMKSGFLNMSRARYSMGLRSVGIAQCDANKMRASVKISLNNDNHMSQYNGASDLELESKLNDLDLGAEQNDSESRSNLRKRNFVKNDSGSYSQNTHIQDLNVEMKEMKKVGEVDSKLFDPLKWFGVLVPPALRQSQNDFRKSAEVAVSVANLKVKMDEYQKEYSQLMMKKKELSSL